MQQLDNRSHRTDRTGQRSSFVSPHRDYKVNVMYMKDASLTKIFYEQIKYGIGRNSRTSLLLAQTTSPLTIILIEIMWDKRWEIYTGKL